MGQHPRLRWNRRRRSIAEQYKRVFIRHNKLIYENREKRYIHKFYENARQKRALKGGSSGRTFGTSHRGSSSQLSLRRNSNRKPYYFEEEEQQEFVNQPREDKKNKHKPKSPCEPLSSEPYVNIEIVRTGRNSNVSFSSGTIVRMACGKGYGLNMAENKTAKCVRGRWRPKKPTCLICRFVYML